jgi:hypothetical protein
MPNTILDWPEVAAIRRKYALGQITFKKLGEDFGVAETTVADVIHDRTWNLSTKISNDRAIDNSDVITSGDLTWEEVGDIRDRRRGHANASVASYLMSKYNICYKTICDIEAFKIWRSSDEYDGYKAKKALLPPKTKPEVIVSKPEDTPKRKYVSSVTKLTWQDILAIRRKAKNKYVYNVRKLAKEYKVSDQTMRNIINKKTWKKKPKGL